jgi:hypothetical protein
MVIWLAVKSEALYQPRLDETDQDVEDELGANVALMLVC